MLQNIKNKLSGYNRLPQNDEVEIKEHIELTVIESKDDSKKITIVPISHVKQLKNSYSLYRSIYMPNRYGIMTNCKYTNKLLSFLCRNDDIKKIIDDIKKQPIFPIAKCETCGSYVNQKAKDSTLDTFLELCIRSHTTCPIADYVRKIDEITCRHSRTSNFCEDCSKIKKDACDQKCANKDICYTRKILCRSCALGLTFIGEKTIKYSHKTSNTLTCDEVKNHDYYFAKLLMYYEIVINYEMRKGGIFDVKSNPFTGYIKILPASYKGAITIKFVNKIGAKKYVDPFTYERVDIPTKNILYASDCWRINYEGKNHSYWTISKQYFILFSAC